MSKKLTTDLLKERLFRLQSNYKKGTSGHNCFGIAAKICDEYKEEEKKQIIDAVEWNYKSNMGEVYYNSKFCDAAS